MIHDIKFALWPVDFSYPIASLEAWLELVEQKAQDAKAANAAMLVMPEYACVHWLAFAGDLPSGESFAWMDNLREPAVEAIRAIARKVGVAIMAGSYPVLVPQPYPAVMYPQPNDTRANMQAARYYNRAYVIDAEGNIIHEQDKMVLTPWELDESNDNVHGGAVLNSFEFAGVKMGLLICLDVQQSVLNHKLYAKDIDVLIVPSMTMHPSGYTRVFTCARARAIEGLIGVVVVGARGVPDYLVGKETNFAGAGFYGPCEMDAKPDGIIAQSVPDYGMTGEAGDLLIADIPVDYIRNKRKNGAEAWPGVIRGL